MTSTIGTPRQTKADRALAEYELLIGTTEDMIDIEANADENGRLTHDQLIELRAASRTRGGAVLVLLGWGTPVEILADVTNRTEH